MGKFMIRCMGERIKLARKRQGLTQQELGELVGLNEKTISLIENDNALTRLDTLIKICDILEVSPNYLLLDSSKNALSEEASRLAEELKSRKSHEIRIIYDFLEALLNG